MAGVFDVMADTEFHKASDKSMELGEGIPVVQCALAMGNPVLHVALSLVGIGPRTFIGAVITDVEEMPPDTKEPAFGSTYKYKLNGYRRKPSSDEFEHYSWMTNDVDCLVGKVPIV